MQLTESSDCAVVAALYLTPSTRSIGQHTSAAQSARSREPGELLDSSETGSDVIMMEGPVPAAPLATCTATATIVKMEAEAPVEAEAEPESGCVFRPPSPTPDELQLAGVGEVDLEHDLSDDEPCELAEEYARPSTPPVEPPPPLEPSIIPNKRLASFINKIKALKSERRFMAGLLTHLMQPYGRTETVSFAILKERFQVRLLC